IGEAKTRGDRYAAGNLRSGLGNLAYLVQGDDRGADLELAALEPMLPSEGFQIPHCYLLIARVNLELYRGRYAEAFKRLDEKWPQVMRSLALRVQYLRIAMTDLHARAHLARAIAGAEVEHSIALVRADAEKIEREDVPFAHALAAIARAGAEALAGDR